MSNVDIKDVFAAFRELVNSNDDIKFVQYYENNHSVVLRCRFNESKYYIYENGTYILYHVYPTIPDDDYDVDFYDEFII